MTKGRVLVTGGAGFIGSHLVDTLLRDGFEVAVLDCLLPQVHADADVDEEGWPVYLDKRAKRIKGNILDEGVFDHSLEGATHLVHLAASVGVGQSMTDIVGYTRNNVLTAAIMLETLSKRRHTVQRMAVASSMSIYGEGEYALPNGDRVMSPPPRDRDQLHEHRWELACGDRRLKPVPTREEKRPQPASIYAINKRDHEEMFLAVGRALEIPTFALRIFNAYGPRQALSNPYTGVAAIFISRLLNDQPPMVFEDGKQMRDFVYVKDVASAFAATLQSDARIWDSFNVGSGTAVSVNDVAQTLARLLRKNIQPKVLQKYRVGDVRHCFADISKLERTMGVSPKQDFEAGMNELIRWVKTARKPVDRQKRSMAELTRAHLVL